ncbi:MAG: universal stress protein [Thermoanaerobaculia bacterium]
MPDSNRDLILVGSSLTPASDAIVRTGLEIARAAGGAVHVAHAVPYPVELFDATMLSDKVLEDLREEERAVLLQQLTEQAERLGIGAGELAGQTVRDGEAHRLLADLADQLHPALVVVGATEAETRITRAFGSTAGRVVRKATSPVLVVREPLPVPPGRVLLAVDLSPLSLEVTRSALAFLDRLEGAPELEVLFVVTERLDRMLRGRDRETDPQVSAQEHLHRFVSRCCTNGDRRVAETVRRGRPGDEIAGRAEETGAELVIVGTHGRSGFERLMIGSVAADVVSSLPTSVLVVPPEAALHAGLAG